MFNLLSLGNALESSMGGGGGEGMGGGGEGMEGGYFLTIS